jgi:hypothetical protein
MLGNGSVKKRYRGSEYTGNNSLIAGRVVLYAVRVASRNVSYSFQNLFLIFYFNCQEMAIEF